MKNLLILLFFIPALALCQCVGIQSFTLTPSPVNGNYEPGTVVTMCYTMDGWNGTSFGANWLEGFGLTLGPGWVSCAPVSGPDDCGGSSTPQQWYWMVSSTNDAGTLTVGPGYFYEGPTGPIDENPGNDWGDFGTTCLWTFCVQLQVSDLCDPLSLLIEVTPYADGTMGSWTNESCFDGPFLVFNGTIAGGDVITTPIVVLLDTVCVGLDQSYSVISTPGSTYDWTLSGGGTFFENGSNEILVEWGGIPGDYIITVQETTVDGCVGDVIDATVNVADTLILFNQPRTGLCIGDTTKLIAFPDDGFWSGENIEGTTFTAQYPGTFFPTYFVNMYGCPVMDSVEVFVRQMFTSPIINTELLEIDLCADSPEQFYYVSEEDGVEYTWHVDGELQSDTDFELYYNWYDSTMRHLITVYGTDTVGCVSELGFLNIDINACHRLYVPNSFTPNGDGYNDALKVVGLSVFDLNFKIYDRYGRELYTIMSVNQVWNGNDGNGYFCPNGVYNWIATYKDDYGFRHREKGHIVLIR
jgi:gliding motility-associated-like protein